MSDFVLSCCAPADLSPKYMEEHDIHYANFHFQLDGKEYFDDMGMSMTPEEFYSRMAAGAETKTSQINANEFEAYFETFLKEGKDILHVSLSSGISGVINSATIAKSILEEKYPDRKIYIIDSLAASSGYGLLMSKLAKLRDEGKDIDSVRDFAEANRLCVNHWFYTDDLKYFIKGGRVTKTAGFVGTMLNICPLLNISNKGELIPRFKIRTKKKVTAATVEQMVNLAKGGLDYSDECFISCAGCPEDANNLKAAVEEKFVNLRGKVEMFSIGTTIGSHSGPGTVALFFWGAERVD